MPKSFNEMSREEKQKALEAALNSSTGGFNPNDPLSQEVQRTVGSKGWNLPIAPPKPDPEAEVNARFNNVVPGKPAAPRFGEASVVREGERQLVPVQGNYDLDQLNRELDEIMKAHPIPNQLDPSIEREGELRLAPKDPNKIELSNPDAPSDDEMAKASRMQWLQQKRQGL